MFERDGKKYYTMRDLAEIVYGDRDKNELIWHRIYNIDSTHRERYLRKIDVYNQGKGILVVEKENAEELIEDLKERKSAREVAVEIGYSRQYLSKKLKDYAKSGKDLHKIGVKLKVLSGRNYYDVFDVEKLKKYLDI